MEEDPDPFVEGSTYVCTVVVKDDKEWLDRWMDGLTIFSGYVKLLLLYCYCGWVLA